MESGRFTALFARPGDIPKIDLLTKTTVASERYGTHKLMHTVQLNSEPMHIKGFWIGLKEEEDTETWLDGTELNQGYWEDGEPNDHYGMEDFAAIKINPMKFWNDATCTSEMQSRKA